MTRVFSTLLAFTAFLVPATLAARVSSIGAAYTLSNDPSGNFVVVQGIAPDGTVSFAGAVSAGGKGAHINVAGPEPFGGQGSIQVFGSNLFTVNAGSNTIVMFKINPLDATKLTIVGKPVASGGDFPVSIGVSPTSGNVCVLNAGLNNSVQCFSANPISGLTPIANSNRALNLPVTNPPDGAANAPSQVIFSQDGKQLSVVVKVNPTNGTLLTFGVNPDGSLSANPTVSQGGLAPFSLTRIPGHDAFLSADAAIGFDVWKLNSNNVASEETFPIAGQQAVCWSTYSSKTGTFFLDDALTSIVTEVKLDANLKGSIVKQYPLDKNSFILENHVASIGSKDYLYVLAANLTSIDVLALNGPGQAKLIQTYNFAAAAAKAGIKIDPNFIAGLSAFTI